MVQCAAFGCLNRSGCKTCQVSFHKFPKDSIARNKWIVAVGRENWTPSSRSVLCSEHFEENSFDCTSLVKIRLRAGAVPSLFVETPASTYHSWNAGPRAKRLKTNEILSEIAPSPSPSSAASNSHHLPCDSSKPSSSDDVSSEITEEDTPRKIKLRKDIYRQGVRLERQMRKGNCVPLENISILTFIPSRTQ